MTTSERTWDWRLWLASWLAMGFALALGGGLSPIAISGDCALAQIAPDTTLGAESPVVTPTNINGITTDRIDGGAIRGSNLFHSFWEFNIDEGRGVYFTNPAGIQNILS